MNNDCLLYTFNFLDVLSIASCLLVNRRLRNLAKNELLWKKFFVEYFHIECSTNFYENFKKYYVLKKFSTMFCDNYWCNHREFKCTYVRSLKSGVHNIPPEIGLLIYSEHIRFANSNLLTIPSTIGFCSLLQILNLDNNHLSVIPDEIGELVSLRVLKLSNNDLKMVPDTIGKLVDIQVLEIAYNQLEILPDTIGNMINLRVLDIANNQLSALPRTSGKIGKFSRFRCKFQSIAKFTSFYWTIKKVR